jgi:hypothetical protein
MGLVQRKPHTVDEYLCDTSNVFAPGDAMRLRLLPDWDIEVAGWFAD